MISYSYIRSAVWTSVCVAASLVVPLSFGAEPVRQQAQAELLDRAAFLCDNCFFGASDYYYCFAADHQILIGYQRTPVLNYQDKSKNYLAPAHPAWAAWSAPGKTVPISYDDKHIWLPKEKAVRRGFWGHMKTMAFWASRADSQQVRLTRSSIRDIFTNSDQCRATDKVPAH
jgi:hypothetical protein